MYQCINCGAVHTDGADRCPACRMPGSLQPMPGAPGLIHRPAQAPPRNVCPNCGIEVGDEDRCPMCHFPLRPSLQGTAFTRPEIRIKQLRFG
ncbi:MAG: hypothetical protein IT269_01595 [Saprospiraceae bacterium]|nr:hypothetical protein [Saprospiraceae bacterium]